jgi:succinyl-diaminopimelate desuccinylase
VNTRLYGRGSADSKVAIAIFAHILNELKEVEESLNGEVSLLVDAEEHSGRFRGIKSYTEKYKNKVKGVFIGYPGNNEIKIGARGFYRAHINVYGTAQHSGSSKKVECNAILKASRLVNILSEIPLQSNIGFPLNPTLNITEIEGGTGYTSIPDLCTVKVDIRLTPYFQKDDAKDIVKEAISKLDKEIPSRRTGLTAEESWPAYHLNEDSPLVTSLINSATKYFKHNISTAISGPSNVGNYLASQGIDATCGFGVSCGGVHGANEYVEIETILPTYYSYRDAILKLLKPN